VSITLIAAVVCLAAWIVLGFITPIGLGVVHLLPGIAAVLWVRWWALRPVPTTQEPR